MNADTLKLRPEKLIGHPLFNFLWYYAVWLMAVFYLEQATPFIAILIVLHLTFAGNIRLNSLQMIAVSCIGILVDSLLSIFNVFQFEESVILPLWLIGLWMVFSTTLNRSLKVFHKYFWLAVLGGSIGGTGSYISGHFIGAVDLGYSLQTTIVVLLIVWSVLFPLLLWVNRTIEKWIEYEN